MATDAELLERIKALVNAGNFRIRPHAAPHMSAEGFSESEIVEAATGKCRILENYPDESRCLVIGYFQVSANVRSPLHLVFEHSHEDAVDVITAYIPQKPWWLTPWLKR